MLAVWSLVMRQKVSMVAAVLAAGLLGSAEANVRNEGTGARSALDAMIYQARRWTWCSRGASGWVSPRLRI